MPVQVLMPALSPTMEKGNLAKWVKQQGDKVKSGDIIAEIETDKATMEVEAVDEGTLGKILVPEGTADVAVNTPIAVILGDGATNQGQVYESFNMAELWKLPVVYIIENNRYAMGTAITRSSATTDLSKRGLSFNIPGEQVDGMDVRAVKAAGEKAVGWCREGKGPYILEMLTYRYRGHSMSDPAKYRTREEVQKMRTEHDPIEQVRARILEKKFASEDELKKVDAEVRDIVNEAAEFATNDPEPDVSELWTDVYR